MEGWKKNFGAFHKKVLGSPQNPLRCIFMSCEFPQMWLLKYYQLLLLLTEWGRVIAKHFATFLACMISLNIKKLWILGLNIFN